MSYKDVEIIIVITQQITLNFIKLKKKKDFYGVLSTFFVLCQFFIGNINVGQIQPEFRHILLCFVLLLS